MTYTSSDNARTRSRRSRWWPLVAALWTAVGLSPCALAAVGELDCLHCPAAENGHAGHGGASHHDAHVGHGIVSAGEAAAHTPEGSNCGDDCLDADDSLVDARSFKPSSKDAGDPLAVSVVPGDVIERGIETRTAGLDPPRHHPVPRRRPHAIFCVYLD